MKKKTKKMIMKVVKRSARILICALLIMTQILPVYASISASDGTGTVTKPEFNSVVADFNSRISKLEMGTNIKIEAAVNEYLSKIDIGGGVGGKGYVINDEVEITGTKDATTGAYSNVTAITGIEIADLKIGDNIYVRDDTASNYYVSQISPTVSLNVLNKSTNNVVDNLTSTDIDKPLSANMGKKLNDEKQDIPAIGAIYTQHSTTMSAKYVEDSCTFDDSDDPNNIYPGTTWELQRYGAEIHPSYQPITRTLIYNGTPSASTSLTLSQAPNEFNEIEIELSCGYNAGTFIRRMAVPTSGTFRMTEFLTAVNPTPTVHYVNLSFNVTSTTLDYTQSQIYIQLRKVYGIKINRPAQNIKLWKRTA